MPLPDIARPRPDQIRDLSHNPPQPNHFVVEQAGVRSLKFDKMVGHKVKLPDPGIARIAKARSMEEKHRQRLEMRGTMTQKFSARDPVTGNEAPFHDMTGHPDTLVRPRGMARVDVEGNAWWTQHEGIIRDREAGVRFFRPVEDMAPPGSDAALYAEDRAHRLALNGLQEPEKTMKSAVTGFGMRERGILPSKGAADAFEGDDINRYMNETNGGFERTGPDGQVFHQSVRRPGGLGISGAWQASAASEAGDKLRIDKYGALDLPFGALGTSMEILMSQSSPKKWAPARTQESTFKSGYTGPASGTMEDRIAIFEADTQARLQTQAWHKATHFDMTSKVAPLYPAQRDYVGRSLREERDLLRARRGSGNIDVALDLTATARNEAARREMDSIRRDADLVASLPE